MKSRDPSPRTDPRAKAAWMKLQSKNAIDWTKRSVPPGLRLVLGLLLVGGGVLGFLPVLGFWMLPLGIAVAALDIRPLGRALMEHIRLRK